ncbi:MEKHLA domain-containing protein [uncultured Shewanella sp.]|uniref:MEKHLA domain-containing protein n=1 Tax=uncultured Shewanella sp. TaxID=173975 RepID=UPI00262F03EF|nr:MEKHLA domain-containing protein [uncultured Shewanella sp.]
MNGSSSLKDIWYALHAERMLSSFKRLTGKDLLPIKASSQPLIEVLDQAPFAILSHGTEADPIFNFANRFALSLFEYSWHDFIQQPSRYSAEALLQEERDALLEQVTRQGFIDQYRGVRISATGKRFMINNAIVWNIIDEQGYYHGQGAMFKDYTLL